jgi:isopentenyl-diphosphate delta-isomerase
VNEELIVLVDDDGKPIGTAPKLPTHHANTPLHLAFSVYIFDDAGRFLVTQRSNGKKVWGGVWTNSCCGHPLPEESFEQAIKRRCHFELGLKVSEIVNIVPRYVYKTPPYRGIIEHEFCPIFVARAVSAITPNPDEVESYQWVDWKQYQEALNEDMGDVYSWWSKDQLQYIQNNPVLLEYSRGKT